MFLQSPILLSLMTRFSGSRRSPAHAINTSLVILNIFLLVLDGAPLQAQSHVGTLFSEWPTDLTIKGTVLVTNSPKGLTAWLESPNASLLRDRSVPIKNWIVFGSQKLVNTVEQHLAPFALSVSKIELFDELSDLSSEGCAWCDERHPSQIPDEEIRRANSIFRRQLDAGGTVCLVGAISAIAGKFIVPTSSHQLVSTHGLNLIPDGVLLVPSDSIHRTDGTIDIGALPMITPEFKSVAVELAPETAAVLRGRKLTVFGPGHARLHLPAGDFLPARSHSIRERSRAERDGPESWMADWTQWRREAIDRTLDRFPPAEKITPRIENGTLIIVGGGGMPDGLMARFVDIAGGSEAKLVYVPCLEENDASRETGILELWRSMGVKQCSLLHTKDRVQANEDDVFLEPLMSATGIWFGGGRQWNLADSYYGTQAHQLMLEVLTRGGVVGGSSAGASIQSNYLARATPIDNVRIMAPGYERGGLGFIRGVAIDQHFSQRGRQKDLRSLIETYPQMFGIGIDEATAVVVRKSTAEIVGQGRVFFYSSSRSEPDGELVIIEQSGAASNVFDFETWQIDPTGQSD